MPAAELIRLPALGQIAEATECQPGNNGPSKTRLLLMRRPLLFELLAPQVFYKSPQKTQAYVPKLQSVGQVCIFLRWQRKFRCHRGATLFPERIGRMQEFCEDGSAYHL